MKTAKKIFALCLSLILVLGVMPAGVVASAEPTEDLGYKLTAEVSYDRYWQSKDTFYGGNFYYNPQTGIFSLYIQDLDLLCYQYNTITDEAKSFYDGEWSEDTIKYEIELFLQ